MSLTLALLPVRVRVHPRSRYYNLESWEGQQRALAARDTLLRVPQRDEASVGMFSMQDEMSARAKRVRVCARRVEGLRSQDCGSALVNQEG